MASLRDLQSRRRRGKRLGKLFRKSLHFGGIFYWIILFCNFKLLYLILDKHLDVFLDKKIREEFSFLLVDKCSIFLDFCLFGFFIKRCISDTIFPFVEFFVCLFLDIGHTPNRSNKTILRIHQLIVEIYMCHIKKYASCINSWNRCILIRTSSEYIPSTSLS